MNRSILSLYTGFILIIFFITTNLMYAQWVWLGLDGSIYTLAVTPNGTGGTNLFAGIGGEGEYINAKDGLFISTNNGANWRKEVNSGLPDSTAVTSLAVNGTNLFAAADGVYLSTDNGKSWSAVNSNLPKSQHGYLINSLAVSPNGTGGINLFVAIDLDGVYLSTNNGKSWSAVNSGLPQYAGIYSNVNSFAISGNNLFAGTNGGVYLSTNNGTNWTGVNSGLPGPNRISGFYLGVGALVVSPNGKGGTDLFAGTLDSVYRSTDNGSSWSNVSFGLPKDLLFSLFVNGTDLFAGTFSGVYLSTDYGTNWIQANSGLTGDPIVSFAVIGNNLYAGTSDGNGLWIRPLSQMITSVNQVSSRLPTNFSLQQNYPNPFNPTTTINYSVPKSGLVTIKVYDILGRELANLVSEQKNAGSYSVQFNAAKLASGVYFYRMQAGDFVDIKKLLLLK